MESEVLGSRGLDPQRIGSLHFGGGFTLLGRAFAQTLTDIGLLKWSSSAADKRNIHRGRVRVSDAEGPIGVPYFGTERSVAQSKHDGEP